MATPSNSTKPIAVHEEIECNAGNEDANKVESDDFDFTPDEQKKIIRRVDYRLIITIGIMYCISLVDRVNMGAANLAGMGKELSLTGFRYNIANLVFFITYTILQAPSTVIIRYLGPRIQLAGITFLWGIIVMCMGFVKNFGQLTGMRLILGALEAGFFPSCIYLLSTWYTRYEVGKRYSAFWFIGCVTQSLSGILAYGLMHLGGHANLSGWRWIFIIEGLITILAAVVGFWMLVDFPDSNRKTWNFLSTRERKWIVHRIQQDRGDTVVPPFNLKKFLSAGADWKIWAYGVILGNTTAIGFALAYTLPVILNESLGFSVAAAQCLVAPPYVFAGILMSITGWCGDKYQIRGPIILINMAIALVGLPIMGWHSNPAVRYFGVFLVTGGTNSNMPAAMAFQANNVRGQWKRAFCSATLVGIGGIGGVAGSLVFREQDKATGYKPGMYACIGFALLSVVLVILCDVEFYRQNKLADSGKRVLECNEDNASQDFRYTY